MWDRSSVYDLWKTVKQKLAFKYELICLDFRGVAMLKNGSISDGIR